jgi:predicted Zn-dependent peptidase
MQAPDATARVTRTRAGHVVVSDAMPGVATAALGLHVGVGARHENAQENGLSHLFEHMAFKGTARRSALQISEEIEAAGGDLNAATSSENTIYQARVLAGDVGLALDILADIVQESALDADELEREKNVVLQEIAAVEDTPDDLVFELFDAAAFPDQPLGRPILGAKKNVVGFSRADLRAWLDRHYARGPFIIAGAGAVEHDHLVALSERLFGGATGGLAPEMAPARYCGGENILKRKFEQANIVVGFESCAHNADDYYAAHVFTNAVGGGMASRLYQEVRERRGLAYSVDAFNWSFSDTGVAGFHAAASPRDIAELTEVAVDCFGAARENLSEREIARAKAQMKVSLLTALESSPARSEQLARQIHIFGRVLTRAEIERDIDALTLGEVRAAGAKMLASAPTLALVGDVRRAPQTARIAAQLGQG